MTHLRQWIISSDCWIRTSKFGTGVVTRLGEPLLRLSTLPERRGERHAAGLEDLPGRSLGLGSQQVSFTLEVDLDFLQLVKVADHVGPLWSPTLTFQPVLQLLRSTSAKKVQNT